MQPTRRLFAQAALAAGAMPAQTAPSFYDRLAAANDEAVDAILRAAAPRGPRPNVRRIGTSIEALTAAFSARESTLFEAEKVVAALETAVRTLLSAQHPDGTIDAGNLHSPPDTAFLVENAATALAVLLQQGHPATVAVRTGLEQFLRAAAAPLVTGGIHTPNHRWVVCAALARIHSLFPDARYVARIDDWLDEGIYIDADGQFAERSTGIYSRVTVNALVTMARLLNRPALLDPARRNLEMNLYYTHADGETETVASRRQDQWIAGSLAPYYLEYRYLALRDGNPRFSAACGLIEERQSARVTAALVHFLEDPPLRQALPAASAFPADYARVFANSGVARIRRGDLSATVFGGCDAFSGVASGLATNPTFFTLRKGRAVIESVRMIADFFSLGHFRSDGLRVEGKRYVLAQKFEAPYYQPLPAAARNPAGNYKLTPVKDQRFWSKLNFPERAMSNVQTLEQRVEIGETGTGFELNFAVTGPAGVSVTIEFVLRPGGTLDGAIREIAKDRYLLLPEGRARLRNGTDVLEIGPGHAAHDFPNQSTAVPRPAGPALYLTALTPVALQVSVATGR